ncbi:TVG0702897 [Thermoplasma volcanium GSS1]|uniref:TVG0702897 protein n=1 Tax=Thermoplasma volcanium (strain ATCC 51530 / DSM 4299 / JCM 9571 / NBRC 15438 / GSS1) TaxID=273116 RepID=Q97AW3_THEVO|nr:hypothetical protein [Thermoplasma volcanium]BAB59838.1 TVG0702897 [Thermoplasma volcanium GSS1]
MQPNKQERKQEPRNFSVPDEINTGLEGKVLTISLLNGRIEAGKLKVAGQYFLEIEGANGRFLIIAKSAIVTVSVMP